MREQEQKRAHPRREEPPQTPPPAPQARADPKRLRERIDAVIEEIDKVVEEHQGLAESYVQQGGQ